MVLLTAQIFTVPNYIIKRVMYMELTKNELQFMAVLWQAGKPMTGAEVLENSVEKSWKDKSLHIMLNRLLQKKAIAEHGFIKDGKKISRTFVPTITREDYYKSVFAGHDSKDLVMLFSAIMRDRLDLDGDTAKKLDGITREWMEK